MTISGISSSIDSYSKHGTHMRGLPGNTPAGGSSAGAADSSSGTNTLATDLNTLLQALGAQDQSGVASMLSQLQSNQQTVGSADSTNGATASASGTNSGKNPLADDLSKLSDALQSGDLTSAQGIFSQIMQHMPPPPPPPPEAGVSGSSTVSAVTATDAAGASNTLAGDFGALGSALQSGDLTGAQSSLAQLMDDLKAIEPADSTESTTASASGANSGKNPLADDLSKLSDALQSGDLTSAQGIFSQIMQHMPPPPPPPEAGVSGSSTVSAVTATDAAGASNTLAGDFGALGSALQSGDLTGAQSSLAQLMDDLKAIEPADSTNSSTASSSNNNLFLDQLLKIWTGLAAATASNNTGAVDVSA